MRLFGQRPSENFKIPKITDKAARGEKGDYYGGVLTASTEERVALALSLQKQVKRRIENIEQAGLHSFALDKLKDEMGDGIRGKIFIDTPIIQPSSNQEGRFNLSAEYADNQDPHNVLGAYIRTMREFLHAKTSTVSGIRETERQQDIFLFGYGRYKEAVKPKSPAREGLLEKNEDGRYVLSTDMVPDKGKRYYKGVTAAKRLTNYARDLYYQVLREARKKFGADRFDKYLFKSQDWMNIWRGEKYVRDEFSSNPDDREAKAYDVNNMSFAEVWSLMLPKLEAYATYGANWRNEMRPLREEAEGVDGEAESDESGGVSDAFGDTLRL